MSWDFRFNYYCFHQSTCNLSANKLFSSYFRIRGDFHIVSINQSHLWNAVESISSRIRFKVNLIFETLLNLIFDTFLSLISSMKRTLLSQSHHWDVLKSISCLKRWWVNLIFVTLLNLISETFVSQSPHWNIVLSNSRLLLLLKSILSVKHRWACLFLLPAWLSDKLKSGKSRDNDNLCHFIKAFYRASILLFH